MAVRAAQELRDGDVVFVGIGLPNLACNLARNTHAPNLFMIYESGAVGTVPERLPISIGDPCLVTDSLSIVSQADIFQTYLQAGLIEVGFLGGAQVDRYGNINTTVIGDYGNPSVRLPGSGGACEIATHARRLLIMMRMSPKSFVETCDFVTSPGTRYRSKRQGGKDMETREQLALPGGGPVSVITQFGVCEFQRPDGAKNSGQGGEMVVTEMYPGATQDDIRKACGWPIRFAPRLRQTPAPTPESLRLLREKLDPQKLYL